MHNKQIDKASWKLLLTGRNAIMCLVLTGGVFLHAINTYLTTTMLPSIVKELGGIEFYAWSTTLFVLMAIVSSAMTGFILQRFGASVAYLIAGVIFFVGSMATAMAPEMEFFLLGRAVQGVGSGMLFSLGYSLIVMLFPSFLWPMAMALLSCVYGVAILIGPAVGGMFAQWSDWRIGFWLLLPTTLLYLVLTFSVLPQSGTSTQSLQVPIKQLLLLALGVLLISVGGLSNNVFVNILGVLAAFMSFFWLARFEAENKKRLFPKGILNTNEPLFWLYATLSLLMMCVAADLFIPFYLQVLHNQPPLIAGYIAALVSAGWVISEVVSARWTGATMLNALRMGPVFIVIGSAILTLCIPLHGDNSHWIVVVVGFALLLVGMGVGTLWPHISSMVLKYSPPGEQDRAGSVLSTVQMTSIAIASALAGIIANRAGFGDMEHLDQVAHSATVLFAVFSMLGVCAVGVSAKLVSVLKLRLHSNSGKSCEDIVAVVCQEP